MDGAEARPTGIRTPDRRVRVFISSTLAELAAEREAARRCIEQMRLTPVLFELGARPHPPRALYSAYLGQSDVFVGIYWERWGAAPPGQTISALEEEYRLSSELPRLLYVKEPAPHRDPELKRLLDEVESSAAASFRRFATPEELSRLLADDLAVLLSERFANAGQSGAAAGAPPARVPAPLTPTVGRSREIGLVGSLLRRDARLVTITGPGGVGKTRLAQVVALEIAAEAAQAVFFVSLAAVREPRLLAPAIAEAVGAGREAGDPLDAAAEAIGRRRSLLVLDNFEHLVTASPDVAELLRRCPRLQVLVTSRQALHVSGEYGVPLAPLDVPPPNAHDVGKAAAVKLFVDRASAIRPDFRVTAANREAIAQLCRRLDGLPLALELAAARIRLLEPDELLERLGQRLELLAGGGHDLPERQRALRTTLDWSYELLSEPERTLFARLSVFVGGATLEAAEAVCGDERVPDVLEVMASLLEKSLLLHVPPAAGPARFQMLQVVRAYAWERLAASGETDRLRARHARWYLDALASRTGSRYGEDRWEVFDDEVDNLRAVMGWALEQDELEPAVALAKNLTVWWWGRGMVWEALDWLERAYALAGRLAPRTADAAWIALAQGNLAGDAGLGDLAEARVRGAIEVLLALGDARGVASGRLTLASALADRGLLGEAISLTGEVLQAAIEADDQAVVEWASSNLATFYIARQDAEAAWEPAQQALAAAERVQSPIYAALARDQLAVVELMRGHLPGAWAQLLEAARIYGASPHLEGLSYALAIAAAILLAEHEEAAAADAEAMAAELHERLRVPVWPVLRPLHERLARRLGPARRARGGARPAVSRADPAAALLAICEGHVAAGAARAAEPAGA